MSKPYCITPSSRRRMDPGTLWPFVWEFGDCLIAYGHTSNTTSHYLAVARHFTVWLGISSIRPDEIVKGTVESFVHHRCQCPSERRGRRTCFRPSRRNMSYLHRFIYFLVERGVVPASALPKAVPSAEPVDERISIFLDWLRRHRGIAESTIITYRRRMERLLPKLGPDPAAYDAGLVRSVVFEESARCPSYTKSITSVLRTYLRFLVANGICRPGLDHAVPTIAQWRLSTLPRYLVSADIEKLIVSCDLTKPSGIRDHAILLLLARLGLRASDIRLMRLDDIDWESGTLRVCGKGRREVRLPLPQDAGDAVLSYLNGVRPNIESDRIFLRLNAPYRPIDRHNVISRVVMRALIRAGITNAPSQGANLLRHSAATAWLRAGATLDAIGTVLRHRSADTTAHYAKVDIPTLQRVVQPWPGDLPC